MFEKPDLHWYTPPSSEVGSFPRLRMTFQNRQTTAQRIMRLARGWSVNRGRSSGRYHCPLRIRSFQFSAKLSLTTIGSCAISHLHLTASDCWPAIGAPAPCRLVHPAPFSDNHEENQDKCLTSPTVEAGWQAQPFTLSGPDGESYSLQGLCGKETAW
jgi:hypothetical protein